MLHAGAGVANGFLAFARLAPPAAAAPRDTPLDAGAPGRYTHRPFPENSARAAGTGPRAPWPCRRVGAMNQYAGLLSAVTAAALLTGCVERRYVVTSDPPGALVLRNGQPLGATPADDHFVYYGNYHFTLIRDGYETLEVDQPVPPPWYEWPAIDFVSENLIPWWIYDVRRFHYQLQPLQVPNSVDVLNRAQELRTRGQGLGPLPGTEAATRQPPVPAAAVPVPVAPPALPAGP